MTQTKHTMGDLPKIESDIPIPRSRFRGGPAATFHEMKIGDSVFFDDKKKAAQFANTGRSCGARHGLRCMIRAVEGGWRVWKVKRNPNGEAP